MLLEKPRAELLISFLDKNIITTMIRRFVYFPDEARVQVLIVSSFLLFCYFDFFPRSSFTYR